jgi:hypothetical protein
MSAFDLHIHSKYSLDSNLEPEVIVEVAKARGLAGIAIVDHNTIQGGIEARKVAAGGLFIICGAEINTEIGDILGLFLAQDIHSREAEEVINEIRSQNGVAILAHPFKRGKQAAGEIMRKLNAVEGFNSRNGVNNKNAKLLAEEYNLPIVAGSDAHFSFEVGRGRTLFENLTDINSESLKQEILNGRTKVGGESSSMFLDILSQGIKIFK